MILPIFRNTKTWHLHYMEKQNISIFERLAAIAKQVKDYNFIPEEVTPDFEKSFIQRFKEFLKR